MKKHSFVTIISFFLFLCITPAAFSEVFGELSSELEGVSLTYHYDSGREYDVEFTATTLSYLRKDVEGREWERGHAYVARKISDNLFYVSWGRDERTEHIAILIDLEKRMLYTSALLEGVDRHFDQANIIKLERL